MLAVEIAQKSNTLGLACDLVTGEERKFADPEGKFISSDDGLCVVSNIYLQCISLFHSRFILFVLFHVQCIFESGHQALQVQNSLLLLNLSLKLHGSCRFFLKSITAYNFCIIFII